MKNKSTNLIFQKVSMLNEGNNFEAIKDDDKKKDEDKKELLDEGKVEAK